MNIPDDASNREQAIHSFLDKMNLNQINVKQYFDSKAKIDSPNVKKLLEERKASPNLKERRMTLRL